MRFIGTQVCTADVCLCVGIMSGNTHTNHLSVDVYRTISEICLSVGINYGPYPQGVQYMRIPTGFKSPIKYLSRFQYVYAVSSLPL